MGGRQGQGQGVGYSKIQRIWESSVVKSGALGWNAKQVKLLHLNPPEDVINSNIKVERN